MLTLMLNSASSGDKVTDITSAPTGSLGGAAKCGSAVGSGTNLVLCTWADSGSVGMLVFNTGNSGTVTVHSEVPSGLTWKRCWVKAVRVRCFELPHCVWNPYPGPFWTRNIESSGNSVKAPWVQSFRPPIWGLREPSPLR